MPKTKSNITFPPIPEEHDPDWCSDIHEILRDMFDDVRQDLFAASFPIGFIGDWHKDLTGVPDLPSGWVECNGQTLNDKNSLLNGVVIPNLNGDAAGADLSNGDNLGKTGDVFLKAALVSGVTEFDAFETHIHDIEADGGTDDLLCSGQGTGVVVNGRFGNLGSAGNAEKHITTSPTTGKTDSTTYPRNFTVVKIMRVK